MSNQSNPYLILGKVFEKPINENLINEFVKSYVQVAIKNRKDKNEAIMHLKDSASELSNAIMNSCVNIQAQPEEGAGVNTSGWSFVPDAAKNFDIEPATINNWIKKGLIQSDKSLGERKTRVLLNEVLERAKKSHSKPNRK